MFVMYVYITSIHGSACMTMHLSFEHMTHAKVNQALQQNLIWTLSADESHTRKNLNPEPTCRVKGA